MVTRTGRPAILALGVRGDPVFVHFVAQTQLFGAAVTAVDLTEVAEVGGWRLSVPARDDDLLRTRDGAVAVSAFQGIYARLILPDNPPGPVAGRWGGLGASLRCWLQSAAAQVVNRPFVDDHNGAKPWHEAWLARHGFSVPDAITSSNRAAMLQFLEEGRAVAKPCSGVRAHTREVVRADLDQYDESRGPVHLQRLISGDDVRVHAIGSRLIASRFASTTVDYREDSDRRAWQCEVPDTVRAAIIAAAGSLGLVFSGWDFKVDAQERFWCLEANPMPGYSWYDRLVHGAITEALVEEMLAHRKT